MKISLKFKIIVFVVVLVNLAVIAVGLVARQELSSSISTSTQQIMELNAQKSAKVLQDVMEKEFYFLEAIAELPYLRDEDITLEQKTAQLSAIAIANPEHLENLAFYNDKGMCIRPDGVYVDVSDQDFFKQTLSGRRFIIDPLPKKYMMEWAGDETIMFYSVPVYSAKNPNKAIGILSSIVNGDDVYNLSDSILIGKNSHPTIMSTASGLVIGRNSYEGMSQEDYSSWEMEQVDDKVKTPWDYMIEAVVTGETGYQIVTEPTSKEKKVVSYMPVGGGSDWAIMCAAPYSEYFDSLSRITTIIAIAIVIAIIIVVISTLILVSLLVKPLGYVKNSINDIATGDADLTKRIDIHLKDEIGDVVSGFNNFTEKLQSIIAQVKKSRDTLGSAGLALDSSTQNTATSIDEILNSIESVHKQISNQYTSVQQTAGAVNEIATNIESLGTMIGKQSAEVSDASAAIEQMIGNIKSVNISMEKMSESFDALAESAQTGIQMQINVNTIIEDIKTTNKIEYQANSKCNTNYNNTKNIVLIFF